MTVFISAIRWPTLWLLVTLFLGMPHAHAQQQASVDSAQNDPLRALLLEREERLSELARLIQRNIEKRDALQSSIDGLDPANVEDELRAIKAVRSEISQLRSAFELIAVGDVNLSVMNVEEETAFDWQKEISEIAAPLVDSLKALTEQPRKISELRSAIELAKERQAVAEAALESLSSFEPANLGEQAEPLFLQVVDKWQSERDSLREKIAANEARLNLLLTEKQLNATTFWSASRKFLLGTGLTLVLAVIAGIVAWAVMRMLWWLYSRAATKTPINRKHTLSRLFAYSYHLLTLLVVLAAVLAVLYVRQDIFLLALSLLVILMVLVGLRQFIPKYADEARLLLNIGPVREQELVTVHGLPWQVDTINVNSVLKNPALNGELRMPLSDIGQLVSRPADNETWFPSRIGDFVLLSDDSFGRVINQTPQSVQLSCRGGMVKSIPTSDYYASSITNLSAADTFGTSIEFGFDYSLQDISLDVIPQTLQQAVQSTLVENGYEHTLKQVVADLQSAGASSLDFMIWASFDSSVAGDYFRINRLLQKACVAVANEKQWSIPFPQLVIHR